MCKVPQKNYKNWRVWTSAQLSKVDDFATFKKVEVRADNSTF